MCSVIFSLIQTGLAFVELVRSLFNLKEVQENKLALLSNSLCQNPLENFFGCQRQKGATNDNPTVQQFLDNTQTLRVVNSFCRGPVRGNCRQREMTLIVLLWQRDTGKNNL